MALTRPKHIVFDVVGTCVSFTAFYAGIDAAIGHKLRQYNITPQHFGFTWKETSELEFTFLSISERYKPYSEVMKMMFYRTLWQAGIPDPRTFATNEERDACVAAYSALELRPGLKEWFDTLRAAGFVVWCFTTGDARRVRGHFERGGVDMTVEHFISCDTEGVAKPALAAYRSVLEKLDQDAEKWFAAAHMWDVSAAVRVGFRGAYCSIYEKESCIELFETEMDVTADTLPDMAQRIIEH